MHFMDDWHDYLRVFDILLALYCIFLLNRSFLKSGEAYTTKTKDYWFAMVLWTVTAVALAVEGLYEDRPLEPRLVFYTLALLFTYKALRKKSDWGASA